jgi:3-oxoacyl-[acyl-carrier protein] reductase
MYTIDLDGKVAMVTGARRGIGRQIALTFARAGAHIAAVSRAFPDGGNDLRREIRNLGGGRSFIVEASVARRSDMERVVSRVEDEFGSIDILVNNAGVIARTPVTEIEDGEWESVLSVNLYGSFLCSQLVGRLMMKQRRGRIINIGSIAGKRGSALYAHYAASKGALLALTKTLAKELGPFGVLVNAIDPGRIETDLLMKTIDTERERWLSETPLNRLGTPGEVAGVALFLASDLASYITGETIEVNGGVLMD